MRVGLFHRIVQAAVGAVRAMRSIYQRLLGWWIGRRRGWTPDTRTYGVRPGYLIRHASRSYWWDGENLRQIPEQ